MMKLNAPKANLHKNLIMKKTVFRYGLYATLAIVIISAFNLFVLARLTGYGGQEIAGYLTMLISMIFVFLGIRYYRDKENAGALSFGQGLKIGVLIVLIASVFFGLFDLLYTEVINPNWMQDYYAQYLVKIKASTPPDKLEAVLKKMESEKEMFSSPVMQFLLMAATVFIIGFMVTIISALTLKRKKQPAL